MIPFALLVAVTSTVVIGRFTRSPLVIAAILALTGVTLHIMLAWSMLDGYWSGASPGKRFASVLAWSPLPHTMSIAALASPIVVLCVGGAVAARGQLRQATKPT